MNAKSKSLKINLRKYLFWCVISVLLTLFLPKGMAQVTTGTISGTVEDETGGVIPGADVVITHVETGRTRTVISHEAGHYEARNLRVGAYQVRGELFGFRAAVRTGINLRAG